MKTALIIGLNGNFGFEMALALADAGWQLKALMRDVTKAPRSISRLTVMQGDATKLDDVKRAAEGVDLIVYAANPAYHRWHQEALAMLEPAVRVAEEQRLQLLFPGNVYAFASSYKPHTETAAMSPPTDKGQIRLRMEQRLQQASQRGARVTVVRAGDFIGQHMSNSWLNMMLKPSSNGFRMNLPHDENHQHYWSYLPDLCRNALQLVEQATQPFEVWHDPGLVISQADWREGFEQAGVSVRIGRFHWWPVRLAAWFSPMIREVVKMRYLWQQPVLMDGSKMQQKLGERCQATPLADIVAVLTSQVAKRNAQEQPA